MLKNITFNKGVYFEAEEVINEVFIPCMRNSEKLNILAAYFSLDSLLEIAEGLEEFIHNQGKISVVVSVPETGRMNPHDSSLLKAHTEEYKKNNYQMFEKELLSEVGFLTKELEKNKIGLVAWFIKKGILEARLSIREKGYNHWKIYTFNDNKDNVVALSSAMNPTGDGFSDNQSNNSTLSLSWFDDGFEESQWEGIQEKFDQVWNNKEPQSETISIDNELADKLLNEIGNPEWSSIKDFFDTRKRKEFNYYLKTSPAFLEYNLGRSSLMPHQVEAVNKVFESWPIRQLFADEVGLGKTLEVGATIAYLTTQYLVKRIVILAPKAVMNQWQSEMSDHFGLNFWIFDSTKKQWIDSVGITKRKESNQKSYSNEYPDFVIISKDYARGRGKDSLFDGVEEYPDLIVVDEAHHARGSKKTKTFKQTLLRRMLEEVKEQVPHIVLASATPMRTHPDEYYYLMELLSLDKFITSEEYLENIKALSLTKDNWELYHSALFVKILKNTLKWCNELPERYLDNEEKDFLLKIQNGEIKTTDFEDFTNNEEVIYSLAVKFNPVTFFTSRSARKVLEKYKDTYFFPERILESTPITSDDIYYEFEIFYNELMRYADSNYLLAEKSMGKQLATTAFAKSGFKQSFVSSFYSALERTKNRKKRIEEYIHKIEDGKFSDLVKMDSIDENPEEELEEDSLEVSPLDEVSEEDLKLVNKDNLLNACNTELASLDGIIDIGNKIIEDKKKENQEPDPKIVKMIEIVKNKISDQNSKPVLIFAHYLATLDNGFSVLKETLDNPEVGIGMFKGSEIWYEIGGKRYSADRKQIKNLLFQGDLQVLFCSEAAAEGINLQAADMMINMDVPWVPSVLEQRIGRIARLGQKAKKVTIHNLWYPDSYEAKMYTALLERQDLMELAMGHFPNIVSDAIKTQVDSDETSIKEALDELDKLKSEATFSGLSKLWNFDKGAHEPYGDNFRKRLIETLSNLKQDTSDYSYSAGEDNVINLRSKILEDFILSNEINQEGGSAIYMLQNEERKLIGFAYEDKESNRKIINPRFLPELLLGIYKGSIKNIKEMLMEADIPPKITEENLFSFYSKEVLEWMVPQHTKVRKDDKGYLIKTSNLEFVELAKIN